MNRAVLNEPYSLAFQVEDRDTMVYPQAKIFVPGSATPFVTLSLDHRASGYYEASYSFTSIGLFNAQFMVFTDVGHTIIDPSISTDLIQILVEESDLDSLKAVLDRILGLSQENYRIFNPVYDISHNLTSATIKTYPSKADAIADTNEIATYTMTASYNAENDMTAYSVVKEP